MSVVRECVLLQYIHSCFHSGVMVFQVTLNVYSQFRLSWMNDVRERVYPFIFTLMWLSFRLPKMCIAVYSYHWWMLYLNVYIHKNITLMWLSFRLHKTGIAVYCYHWWVLYPNVYIHNLFTLVWWAFMLHKTCITVYSYHWWVLYLNVYIHSFCHSGVMGFQVTQNVYSRL